ncbi:MAG: CPBP family intramembrane glutamic endopeptidase [Bacteroidota bacterium]
MNYSKILLFLGLTFGLSILSLFIPGMILENGSILEPILKLMLYCWAPAGAAILTQKYIYKGSMARYGWNRKRFSFSWIGLTLLLPVGVVFGTVLTVFIMGNVLRLPGFGEVIMGAGLMPFGKASIFTGIDGLVGDVMQVMLIPEIQMPAEIVPLFVMILIGGIIGGTTINLLFNVGEEVGWRGFMLSETKSMGFMGSNLIVGSLWGMWYIPLLFDLSSLNSTAILGDLLALVGYSVSLAYVLAYLSIKTRSVYASATFHGVLNNISLLSFFFIWGENPLFGSIKGLAGMFVFLFLTFLIIRFDKPFIEKYREWVY